MTIYYKSIYVTTKAATTLPWIKGEHVQYVQADKARKLAKNIGKWKEKRWVSKQTQSIVDPLKKIKTMVGLEEWWLGLQVKLEARKPLKIDSYFVSTWVWLEKKWAENEHFM